MASLRPGPAVYAAQILAGLTVLVVAGSAGLRLAEARRSRAGVMAPKPEREAAPPLVLASPPAPTPPVAAVELAAAEEMVIGTSVEGRPVTALRYGPSDCPNVTVIFFGFHGDETAAIQVGPLLVDYLDHHADAYANACVYVVPQANPDGVAQRSRTNAHGVDLNRNYPWGWQPDARAARYHPGPSPLSEPEARAAGELVRRSRSRKVLSIHAPLRMLCYTHEIGQRMAALMTDCGLPPDLGAELSTPGSFGDYCGRELQVGIVTVELPDEDADAAWQRLRSDMLRVIATPL